ncbi:MAG: YciI family protein [Litorimonas sp.]
MIKLCLVSVSALMVFGFAGCTQDSLSSEPQNLPPSASVYDAKLVAKLGADEYGMRSYVMVVLKTGPKDAEITDADERAEIFKGHFSNMKTLAEAKKLVLSGPFIEGEGKRGLYIFNVATIPEAEELVQSDPAVAAGIFVPEFTKYYGSAALMQIQEVHQTIQKTKI